MSFWEFVINCTYIRFKYSFYADLLKNKFFQKTENRQSLSGWYQCVVLCFNEFQKLFWSFKNDVLYPRWIWFILVNDHVSWFISLNKACFNPGIKVKYQYFISEWNSLFLCATNFAGAAETSSTSEGQHGRGPADVQPFSYFVPATHNFCYKTSTCFHFWIPQTITGSFPYFVPG